MLLDLVVRWRLGRYILPGIIFPAVCGCCRGRVGISGVRVTFAGRTVGEGRFSAI